MLRLARRDRRRRAAQLPARRRSCRGASSGSARAATPTVYAYVHCGVTDRDRYADLARKDLLNYAVVDAYANQFARAGFADDVEAFRDRWKARDRDAALAAIGDAWVDAIQIMGDADARARRGAGLRRRGRRRADRVRAAVGRRPPGDDQRDPAGARVTVVLSGHGPQRHTAHLPRSHLRQRRSRDRLPDQGVRVRPEKAVHRSPDGAVAHAELSYCGSYVGLSDRIPGAQTRCSIWARPRSTSPSTTPTLITRKRSPPAPRSSIPSPIRITDLATTPVQGPGGIRLELRHLHARLLNQLTRPPACRERLLRFCHQHSDDLGHR